MKLVLLLLLLSLNCTAQQSGYMRYLNNSFITDAKGQPKIPVQYYPPSTFIKYVWDVYDVDTKQHHNEPLWIPKERLGGYGLENVKLGTETMDWMLNNISYTLHYLGEPILYNYYIGKTVYRVFNQAGLMNFDYVIDIVKEADSQYLYIKIPMGRVGQLYSNSLDSFGRMILPTEKPDIYSYRQSITLKQFNRIKYVIDSSRFIKAPCISRIESRYLDVSSAIVEVHDDKGYKYAFRWMDGEQNKDIIDVFSEIYRLSNFYEHEQKVLREVSRREQQHSER